MKNNNSATKPKLNKRAKISYLAQMAVIWFLVVVIAIAAWTAFELFFLDVVISEWPLGPFVLDGAAN